MPEYIDREAILKIANRHFGTVLTEDIQAIPAADVAPVVRGSWCLIISDFDDNALQCSICGKKLKIDDDADISEYRACPFCTAIMDGGNDNV